MLAALADKHGTLNCNPYLLYNNPTLMPKSPSQTAEMPVPIDASVFASYTFSPRDKDALVKHIRKTYLTGQKRKMSFMQWLGCGLPILLIVLVLWFPMTELGIYEIHLLVPSLTDENPNWDTLIGFASCIGGAAIVIAAMTGGQRLWRSLNMGAQVGYFAANSQGLVLGKQASFVAYPWAGIHQIAEDDKYIYVDIEKPVEGESLINVLIRKRAQGGQTMDAKTLFEKLSAAIPKKDMQDPEAMVSGLRALHENAVDEPWNLRLSLPVASVNAGIDPGAELYATIGKEKKPFPWPYLAIFPFAIALGVGLGMLEDYLRSTPWGPVVHAISPFLPAVIIVPTLLVIRRAFPTNSSINPISNLSGMICVRPEGLTIESKNFCAGL